MVASIDEADGEINHMDLFPPIQPDASGHLDVGDGHQVYWEQCGAADGLPALVTHGGPGAGCAPAHRRFFDPARFRIVLFDQRGAGRSRPHAGVKANTTAHLIADMERLRAHLGIERWLLFGGSWGSTLALAYAQARPARCLGLVLRGVFLGGADEADWFLHGMGRFFPEAERDFLDALPAAGRADPLAAYHAVLMGDDATARLAAARAWSRYEAACSALRPSAHSRAAFDDPDLALALARISAHYFRNDFFLQPDALIDGMAAIRHLPGLVVQGRYDVVCPIRAADRLVRAWPRARLRVVDDAGHSIAEPGVRSALLAAVRDMAHGLAAACAAADKP